MEILFFFFFSFIYSTIQKLINFMHLINANFQPNIMIRSLDGICEANKIGNLHYAFMDELNYKIDLETLENNVEQSVNRQIELELKTDLCYLALAK